MARTFNRQPYSVPMPSKNDVKNYFMTQANWKGVIKNNNFLAVDQESFEDAQNVYIDDKFLLKSRPSVKIDENVPSELTNTQIDDVHVFANELVFYLIGDVLKISKNNVITYSVDVSGGYKLLQIEDCILVFTTQSLKKVFSDGAVKDADIYIPKTKLVKITGEEENLESINIFTDSQITVYQYSTNFVNLNTHNTLIGKTVKVKFDDKYFEFTFDDAVHIRLFKDLVLLKSDLLLTKMYDNHKYKYLPFCVSKDNTYAYYDKNSKEIFYSTDGVVFKSVTKIPGDLAFDAYDAAYGTNLTLKFCRKNSAILCVMLKRKRDNRYVEGNLHMISVENDLSTGKKRYESLTQIATSNSYGIYNSLAFDALDYDSYVVETAITSDQVGGNSYSFNAKGLLNGKSVIYTIGGFADEGQDIEPYFYVNNLYMTDTGLIYVTNTTDVINIEYHSTFGEVTGIFNTPVESITHVLGSFKVEILDNRTFYVYDHRNNDETYYFNGEEFVKCFGYPGNFASKGHYGILFNNVDNPPQLVEFELTDPPHWKPGEELINVEDTNNFIPILCDDSTAIHYAFSDNDGIRIRNNVTDMVFDIEVTKVDSEKYFVPNSVSQLNSLFVSKHNKIYISQEIKNDNVSEIYFPEINSKSFTSKITNLHPLSENEMGVFLENEIWYSHLTDTGYAYRKSRLDFGCRDGNEITTSFDGKYTLFDTDRGFAALAYQDFVASTEQSVTFISDLIESMYKSFRKNVVKLTKFDNYLLLYNGTENVLVYDLRNNSWWPWKINNLNKFIRNKDEVIVIKNHKVCKLDYTSANYYDFDNEVIEWYLTSQKLHLNANNYDKHIINMTFSTVEDDDFTNPFIMRLDVKNYRHFIDEVKEQSFGYKVELIRTFVKRLNYAKVREFQYTLSTDNENAIKLPLSLSAITIKYKIGGQVR